MHNRAVLVMGALFTFVFGLLMIGNVIPIAIDTTLAENIDENFNVTTGPGETSAVCGLTYEHYYGDTTHMTALSSSGTDTATAIMSYDADTYDVTVGGLAASTTRIINIDYYRERDNESFTYFVTFIKVVPFFLCVGLVYMLVKSFF